MKPRIYRTCSNVDCEIYDREFELADDEETSGFYISPYCPKCQREGRLRLLHNGIEAESVEAFYARVSGMAKEFHLLRKLITKGVADPEDRARHDEILNQINGLECTSCGQKLIDHEH